MALAETQQGISLPTIVLIDEKYDPLHSALLFITIFKISVC